MKSTAHFVVHFGNITLSSASFQDVLYFATRNKNKINNNTNFANPTLRTNKQGVLFNVHTMHLPDFTPKLQSIGGK
jgi:uncharacterized protein YeeX (DUF496 family)